jgi:hypothetical protein
VKSLLGKKKIAAALARASQLRGQSVEELTESCLPTFGLDANGTRRQRIGDHEAEVFLESPRSFAVRWRKGSATPTVSVPAAVERKAAQELAAFQRELKELNGLLTAQRWRLESLLRTPRTWSYGVWQERYLQHPLVGVVARHLIWEFASPGKTQSAIWHAGQLIDSSARPLGQPAADTTVTLWHPLAASAKETFAWRCWLEEFLVAQPFRQAFREIYRPAGKELKATSSDRFAGHLLKQHQFAALARERGWRYQLQGAFDSFNTPTLELPEAGLIAELDLRTDPQEDISASGMYLTVGTRQIRFRDRKRKPVALSQVPARSFSEVMRDVDLFVGVASVGNDADWSGRSEKGRFGEAWQRHAFGELTVMAEARRERLKHLLPRLELRATIEGRFLRVQGQLRAYKIHLGSGHVLMEPNDEFLSFPRAAGANKPASFGNLLRPLADDAVLVEIIQRAVLLAADKTMRAGSLKDQIAFLPRKNLVT